MLADQRLKSALISAIALSTISTKSTVLLGSPVGVLRLACSSLTRLEWILTKETLYDIDNHT
jgi:hypothetical protein